MVSRSTWCHLCPLTGFFGSFGNAHHFDVLEAREDEVLEELTANATSTDHEDPCLLDSLETVWSKCFLYVLIPMDRLWCHCTLICWPGAKIVNFRDTTPGFTFNSFVTSSLHSFLARLYRPPVFFHCKFENFICTLIVALSRESPFGA
jgi:hypothetical protein